LLEPKEKIEKEEKVEKNHINYGSKDRRRKFLKEKKISRNSDGLCNK